MAPFVLWMDSILHLKFLTFIQVYPEESSLNKFLVVPDHFYYETLNHKVQ